MAALIAWKLIVASAINTANKPAAINIHALMLIRYAKSLSQLFITNHAMGEATTNAINTSRSKSFESSNQRFAVKDRTCREPGAEAVGEKRKQFKIYLPFARHSCGVSWYSCLKILPKYPGSL